MGINRISIGLQSVHQNELERLGRAHSYADFVKVFEDARAAGFDNISADLMYGIPEQTVESFEESLRTLCALSPEHISAYGLKIEEGTVFGRTRDSLILPDEDEEYEMYCLCERVLAEHGYERYEISNFAREGRHSRHNTRYWRLEDYIGFGVAAHSCLGRRRFGNSRDLKGFLNGENITEEDRTVSDTERANEYIMLGLRLGEGMELETYRNMSGKELTSRGYPIDKLIADGFLWRRDGRLGFTTKGFFVSNAILSDILEDE